MTSRTKNAAKVPVEEWWEPIDETTSVLIARQAVEEGGYIYELSATLIVDRPATKRAAVEQGNAAWMRLAEIRDRHGGRLPLVARVEGTKIVALFDHSAREAAVGDVLHHPSSRRDFTITRIGYWHALVRFDDGRHERVPHKFVHGCVRYLAANADEARHDG